MQAVLSVVGRHHNQHSSTDATREQGEQDQPELFDFVSTAEGYMAKRRIWKGEPQ